MHLGNIQDGEDIGEYPFKKQAKHHKKCRETFSALKLKRLDRKMKKMDISQKPRDRLGLPVCDYSYFNGVKD